MQKNPKENRRVQARVCAEDLRQVNVGFPTQGQDDSSVSEAATSESIPDKI
jgi:hypothetical protein